MRESGKEIFRGNLSIVLVNLTQQRSKLFASMGASYVSKSVPASSEFRIEMETKKIPPYLTLLGFEMRMHIKPWAKCHGLHYLIATLIATLIS